MKKLILASLLFSQSIIAEIKRDNENQTYRIDKNQTEQVSIQNENYSVTLKEIIDSRCPPGMALFSNNLWEGNFKLDLEITIQNGFSEDATVVIKMTNQP